MVVMMRHRGASIELVNSIPEAFHVHVIAIDTMPVRWNDMKKPHFSDISNVICRTSVERSCDHTS